MTAQGQHEGWQKLKGWREGKRELTVMIIKGLHIARFNLPKSAASSKVFILYQWVGTVEPSANKRLL